MRPYIPAFALLCAPALALICVGVSGCTAQQKALFSSDVSKALQSPAGQLFCTISKNGGSQVIVGLIDAEATAAAGAAAPVAILATGAAASVVQADCAAAAVAVGADAGFPVSPPVAAVANVAVKAALGSVTSVAPATSAPAAAAVPKA